ncbi:MAG: hypothetical protein JRG96_02590 [Deltaproteobacteria bacterium]|nr:hypothetical protein [Deltaproteobacteria bacterium]MBW2419143.1 hypothetical protein [Deltaproteobacteria bacterium]
MAELPAASREPLILIAVVVVLGAYLLVGVRWSPELASSDARQAAAEPLPARRMLASGLNLQTATRGGDPLEISIARIYERSHKLGVVTANPLKELIFEETRLGLELAARAPRDALDEPESVALEVDFDDAIGAIEALRGRSGIVRYTAVIMQPVAIRVADGAEHRYWLRADRARVHSTRSIEFSRRLAVSSSTGQELRTRKARWHHEGARLEVPGSYVLTDSDGPSRGSGATFVLRRNGRIEQLVAEGSPGAPPR